MKKIINKIIEFINGIRNVQKVPTDLQILKLIYQEYYEDYAAFSKDNRNRDSKLYVPINIQKIADKLAIDGDIVFSRLNYYLNKKHSFRQDDNSMVYFFWLRLRHKDKHCINFPLMASVLAELKDKNKKFIISIVISIISLIIAIISIFVSIY